jgi:hypothetical protein
VRHCEKQIELSTLFLPELPQIPTPFSWVQTSRNESRDPFQPQVGSIWFQHICRYFRHLSAHFRVLGALQVSNNQSAELKLCHPFDWNPTWVGQKLEKKNGKRVANWIKLITSNKEISKL